MNKADKQPTRLLLIDDDEVSRELMALLLENEGYQVATADSGEAALQTLTDTHAPDAILADLQMPGLSGAALAAALRAATTHAVTLLAMSGSAPQQDAATGYDRFLLKPFRVEDLAAALAATAASGAPNAVSASPAQAQPGSPAAPLLDEAVYNTLLRSMPREQLHQLYAVCLDDVNGRVERMQLAAASNDAESFRREAHAIKGGCGMVGATALQQLAARLEQDQTAPANHVATLQELLLLCKQLQDILFAR
ncbi:MAG: response regulator [Acidobacteriota bacterium]|nr:response regulator [Acidobacteriota bacterium]